MGVETRDTLFQDGASDVRSLGSNYHPSSQSRKMSVGILIDSLANKKLAKDAAVVPNEGMETAQKGNSGNEKDKGKDVAAKEGKLSEAPEQVASPWITTKSPNKTAESSLDGRGTLKQSSAGGSKRTLRNKKGPPVPHSVKFFANQSSNLNADNGKEKLSNGLTYKRKESRSVSPQREEEFTFPTARGAPMSDQAVAGNVAEPKTDILKTKLWELLGAVSSPKSQPSNIKSQDFGGSNPKPEKVTGSNGNPDIRSNRNSDTIEIDSESPAHSMKRPVTRASVRKRSSTKRQPSKPRKAPCSTFTKKLQKNNVFTFHEGLADKGEVDVRVDPSTSTRSKSKAQTKKATRAPRKKSLTNDNDSGNLEGQAKAKDVPAPTGKTSSNVSKMKSLFNDILAQNVGRQQSFSHQFPREEDHHQSVEEPELSASEGFTHPTIPRGGYQHQDFGNSPFINTVSPQENMGSPTLKISSPVSSTSPSSPQPEPNRTPPVNSPVLSEKSSPFGNMFHFRTSEASKPGGSAANSETVGSDDDVAVTKDSPEVQSSPDKVVKDGDGSGHSLSEDGNYESSEEGTPIAKGQTRTPFPEMEARGKSESKSNSAKRQRTQERDDKLSPTLSSPKGSNDEGWTQVPGENFGGDEYERVVMLFAMALENYVKKVKSATMSKSSEIMMQVSKEIHQQLKNVKLQIHEDMVNMTTTSTSKRKRVEASFREEAEQLKTIHEKFQQDIRQCLQNYNSALDGLEAHQSELKATIKKKKASHQKIMVQVEETVETLLADARSKVQAVHKKEKEKMGELRYVVSEVLGEEPTTRQKLKKKHSDDELMRRL
ncbi:Meiosis-specific protein ASY3 [Linum grandiflorum]